MDNASLKKIVVGVVRNVEGEVLIIERAKKETGQDGAELAWAFPGGEVEQDETHEKTIKREIYEETGYEVEVHDVIAEGPHPQFPVYIYYVRCTLKREFPALQAFDPEIKDIRFVRPEELRAYFTTALNPTVASYLGI